MNLESEIRNRLKSIEHKMAEAYAANFDIIAEGFPARMNARRADCMEAFMLAGLPDAKDERFLQNDMREIFGREEREMYFTAPRSADRFHALEGFEDPVVTENGFFSGGRFEQRTDGVVCGSLRGVFNASEGIMSYYNSVADNSADPLTALNSAFVQDGVAIYVPDGVDAGQIVIDNRFSSDDDAQLSFGRTLIVLGEGASAEVVMVYRTAGKTRFLVDHVREAVIGKSAVLRLSEMNLMGEGSNLLLNSYMKQAGKSRTESVFTLLGTGDARFALRTDLVGDHAEADLWGLYLASDQQIADVELRMNHLAPDCRSGQMVKGIAAGEAKGVFTGMVYVAQNAQRTDAGQQNRNLQLDDSAHIYTRPQLEIYADDVKCGHGATVGQLNEDEVYYMRQRGIADRTARRMQMEGFVNDIIGRSPSVHFQTIAAAHATQRINEL